MMKEIVNAVIPSVPTVQGSAVLTESEEQAVRYVAGYVLMKLKKKYLKVKSSPEATTHTYSFEQWKFQFLKL